MPFYPLTCALPQHVEPAQWPSLTGASSSPPSCPTSGPRSANPRSAVTTTATRAAGWRKQSNPRTQRGNAAHLNAFEAFAPFATGVLMAQAAGVDPGRIAALAVAFIVCRVLHGLFYIADKHALRSLVWAIGIGCVVALMVQAALRVG